METKISTSPDGQTTLTDPDARAMATGIPIFARGACWAPTTSFVAEVDDEHHRQLIEQAAHATMNMIRVWGGGISKPDAFYNLCDELGLLVWQDFMFACDHYPEDEATLDNVGGEILDQVRHLRNHPCLALWGGAVMAMLER